VRKVVLGKEHSHHLVARRAPDGTLDVSCVKGPEAAHALVDDAVERSGK
jgi:hypothetical protein